MSALLAYKLDEAALNTTLPNAIASGGAVTGSSTFNSRMLNMTPSTVFVLDVGFSQCTAGIYKVEQGLYSEIVRKQTDICTAATLVKLLVAHCVKDFKKKFKVSCADNARSMLKLQRECELLIKMLSTSNEATITIDALYDSFDYSVKLTRAKFEDVCIMPFMQLKNFLTTEIFNNSEVNNSIGHILLVGGLSSVPKVNLLVKSIFASFSNSGSVGIEYPKLLNIDSSEVGSIGACYHGTMLYKQVSVVFQL